jgi:hypothetical protein
MNKFTPPGILKKVNATILAPVNAGLRIILNVCGQNGKFENDLDKLLTKRWSKVRSDFKEWYATQNNFKLGSFNNTAAASDTWICNLLVKNKEEKIDEKLLATAFSKFATMVKYEKASVHISDILLTDTPQLQDLIVKYLLNEGVNVYIYTEQK